MKRPKTIAQSGKLTGTQPICLPPSRLMMSPVPFSPAGQLEEKQGRKIKAAAPGHLQYVGPPAPCLQSMIRAGTSNLEPTHAWHSLELGA